MSLTNCFATKSTKLIRLKNQKINMSENTKQKHHAQCKKTKFLVAKIVLKLLILKFMRAILSVRMEVKNIFRTRRKTTCYGVSENKKSIF